MKYIKNHINDESNQCLCKICRMNRALNKEDSSLDDRMERARQISIKREEERKHV